MFTLPFRLASHRINDLDKKFITPNIQEKKQAIVLIEEIEEVELSDHHRLFGQPQSTIPSSQVVIFTQEPLPSPQQEDAVIEKPPPYESYLIGVLDAPSAPPPLPPTPRLRPIKHPYIRSSDSHKQEKNRTNYFPEPGNLPLTPPTTPPTNPFLSDTDHIPRLCLKRARSLDSYDEQKTPTCKFRETKPCKTISHHPLDLTHLRHVWHHKRVYLVDPEEDGKAFECLDPHGCVWIQVEDGVLVVSLRKKMLVWDERVRRRWGFKKRCAVVGR